MRSKGKIATWHNEKGYGFIKPFEAGPQVFIHIKAFGNRDRRPTVGEVVTYAVTRDKLGRFRAESATLSGDKLVSGPDRKRNSIAVPVALVFLTVVGVSVFWNGLPLLVFVAYLTVSAATFVIYAIDKGAAQSGRWRTSEGALHLLALAGGWPGALIAQQTFRHKSKKSSFRLVFWVTVILNCAAFLWLHSSDGRASIFMQRIEQQMAVPGE